jgi:hypothetical protein
MLCKYRILVAHFSVRFRLWRISLEVTTPQQLKGNRRRPLSVRVALIEDEAVPRTDKPSLEDAFVPRIDFTEKNRKSASVLFP